MIKGVVDDISLMWRAWVSLWVDEEVEAGVTERIWGTNCTRRRRVVNSDASDNKRVLDKFYDDLFNNMQSNSHNLNQPPPRIKRTDVVLDKATQLQVYNALYTTDGLRCHQCEFRKLTESTISIQNVSSTRAEFEGKRWVFGWSEEGGQAIPELSSRAYMVSLFSEVSSEHIQ
jgi:hypothetical protein